MRKPGQRKTDLSDETGSEVLKKAKTLIRTDFGGRDAVTVIITKMKDKGIECGPKSAQAIKELCEEQVSGCRARANHRLDEAIARFEEIENVTKVKERLE